MKISKNENGITILDAQGLQYEYNSKKTFLTLEGISSKGIIVKNFTLIPKSN